MLIARKFSDLGTNELCKPELSQLSIQDLCILCYITENDLKKYYTADLESVPYGVVELMLDTRNLCRNMSKHRIRSYQDELVLDYEYLESEIVFATDNKAYIPTIVAADIMNLTLEQITDVAQKDGELYFDDDDTPNVSTRWLVDYLGEAIRGIGGTANEITIGNNGQGRIKIIIKRELR